MSLKKQLHVLKENWVLALAVVVLILVISNFNLGNVVQSERYLGGDFAIKEGVGVADSVGLVPGYYGEDFAPGVETRKIVYSASLGVEVERGDFAEAEDEFDSAVAGSGAIVLNRNVNTYGEDFDERQIGYYNLRVDVRNMDALLADLREIGEVQSESKDAYDITGSYVRLEERLRIESEKLARLKTFLNEAESISDKILLNEQIAEQERTIEYLKEALNSEDERVEYATVSFSIEEESSEFANITFVTFGELVRGFVTSLAGLLKLIFVVIPYAVVIFIFWLIFRKRR
ncbi:hypothetical protein CO038_00375 [Candidatus Pacearchaeota archaeon CG_4_9_14_0_2_um_filter_39_13]|nr:DUF4349 domain-containing protein [Candidatus Pacearchaeota archaeon]OIO42829.1 MAG: hypothetical protein AUJ64_03505 [Candidatus Pacearchaeota archaeon CG1_02_39_14]PJC45077.1 MAG: hypothetical protein CO038_00375 [Candidatus Pacearchaeota archaeon CG_4_9_14_0_2_um_filter_39_13]